MKKNYDKFSLKLSGFDTQYGNYRMSSINLVFCKMNTHYVSQK